MSGKRKSWREKLADDMGLPQVCEIDETKRKRWGAGTFVIPAPREVDELMRRVPKGRLTTVNDIRKALARKHGTAIACPITTGIFAWIAPSSAAAAAVSRTGETRGLCAGSVRRARASGDARAAILRRSA